MMRLLLCWCLSVAVCLEWARMSWRPSTCWLKANVTTCAARSDMQSVSYRKPVVCCMTPLSFHCSVNAVYSMWSIFSLADSLLEENCVDTSLHKFYLCCVMALCLSVTSCILSCYYYWSQHLQHWSWSLVCVCALCSGSQYGEVADECGDAYFWYGKALLEVARQEGGVLGDAMPGGTLSEISGIRNRLVPYWKTSKCREIWQVSA